MPLQQRSDPAICESSFAAPNKRLNFSPLDSTPADRAPERFAKPVRCTQSAQVKPRRQGLHCQPFNLSAVIQL
jgi:hypothetical protein